MYLNVNNIIEQEATISFHKKVFSFMIFYKDEKK
jgi:hypothetical protein